jgi:endoglucanase
VSSECTRIALCLVALQVTCHGQYLRGVNLAGAEFGEASIPGAIGSTHTYNSAKSFQYFAARSLGLIRLPIRWERLQPALRGPLDPTNLAALKQDVKWAQDAGCKLAIDPHNFGRYKIVENGKLVEYIIDAKDGKVTTADFADFWARMSVEFKDEPAVYAYDLMNEPHDMGSASWKTISQAAVSAIRANGDNKLILVPGGASYSAAHRWPNDNGATSWISDPANNFMYEAHQYFDSDNSGSYARTYDQELAGNPNLPVIGPTRIAPFVNWCRNNNVRCFLGEYGVPNNDPRWLTVLDNLLKALDDAGMDGAYWAAGEWWGNYILSVQPANNFTTDRAQTPILLGHLAADTFTSVSAAAVWGYSVSPGSYVAGFGKNVAADSKVQLTDSTGNTTSAPIVAAVQGQVNYLVPDGIPLGRVDVKLITGEQVAASGVLIIEATAPTLFSANNSGQGIAAAQVLRVKADGSQSYENVARFDNAKNTYIAAPVFFGGDRLFLILYGTGFKNSTASNATLKLGSTTIPVAYAGAQNQYPGLDQVNAELPNSLAGAGEIPVSLTISGKTANGITVAFQ